METALLNDDLWWTWDGVMYPSLCSFIFQWVLILLSMELFGLTEGFGSWRHCVIMVLLSSG